jgi:hypothetical protein
MAKKAKPPRAGGATVAKATGAKGAAAGAALLSGLMGIASPQARYAPTPFIPNRDRDRPPAKAKGKGK